jgi:hypothetical protein
MQFLPVFQFKTPLAQVWSFTSEQLTDKIKNL